MALMTYKPFDSNVVCVVLIKL